MLALPVLESTSFLGSGQAVSTLPERAEPSRRGHRSVLSPHRVPVPPQLYPASLLHGSHGASSCPVPNPGLPGPVLSGNFRDLVLPGSGLTWRRRSDWKSRGRRAWFFCPLTRGKPELVLGPHGVGSGELTPRLLPDGPGGPARAQDVTPSVRPRASALLPSFTTTFGHPFFVTFPGSWASAGWQQAPSLREHRGSGPAWGCVIGPGSLCLPRAVSGVVSRARWSPFFANRTPTHREELS